MTAHTRPSWDAYFMEMATLVATRATCPRRRVGAVLVRENRIISTGYNGAIKGAPHCDEVGCLMVDGHCVRTVHAEVNAILQCAIYGVSSLGATLYCTDFPCVNCAKALIQAGVKRLVYKSPYPDANSTQMLQQAGVALHQWVEAPAQEPLP